MQKYIPNYEFSLKHFDAFQPISQIEFTIDAMHFTTLKMAFPFEVELHLVSG